MGMGHTLVGSFTRSRPGKSYWLSRLAREAIVSYNRISGIDGGMMTAKLNPEFVKATFEAEGYRLLNDYENAHKPIAFICPKGHDHRISWTSFQQGGRCAYCAGKAVKPETVWAAFEVEGYVLLGEYPEKSSKPIPFICPKGHRHQMSWSHSKEEGVALIVLGIS
jgi:hypothetical protein